MLQIKNVSKRYKKDNLTQIALNNVSLSFKNNDFVAVLGPSGSGKTTLLNIIGGLDTCDSGDLIVNDVSTKDYKEKDWNKYRNHTIGFVFQSRNLISHQTILTNIELALIITGVSKKERRNRALLALDEVGLKNQAHKKPNQLSGGQMQKVAIARALVNNPDILLVDEPTSSLDEKSSLQVMELLKKVAEDRLVIMVTHNPDLANNYAKRIIRLQDGVVVSDSNPFVIEETKLKKRATHLKKTHMSFFDALSFSFHNLLTKKGRTILTTFTVSIGIIGIALDLSLLNGFQNYEDKIKKETISNFPITITSDLANTASKILSMASDRKENDDERIIEKQYLSTLYSTINLNDLKSFKIFVEDNKEEIEKCTSQIKYTYSVIPQIYTVDASNKLIKINPNSNLLFDSYELFSEMPNNVDSIKDQYDLLKGRWPNKYDELIVVLSEPNSISDLFAYSLGLRDNSELKTIVADLMEGNETQIKNEPLELSYDDLMNVELKLIKATDLYKFNDEYFIYEDMKNDEEYMKSLYDNSMQLKIVGIVCPSNNASLAKLSTGIHYTEALTQYVINQATKTSIVQNQLRNKDVDILSLKRFDDESEETIEIDFEDMISVDYDLIENAIQINSNIDDFDVDQDAIKDEVTQYTKNMISSLTTDTSLAKTDFENTLEVLCKNYIKDYINTYKQSDMIEFSETNKNNFSPIFFASNSFNNTVSSLISKYVIPTSFSPQLNAIYQVFTEGVINSLINTDKSVAETTDVWIETVVSGYLAFLELNPIYNNAVAQITSNITVFAMGNTIRKNVEKITKTCLEPLETLSNSYDNSDDMVTIDTNKFTQAIKLDVDQDELSRIMSTVNSSTKDKTYRDNLISLGYQDIDEPTSIMFYFNNQESKENFLNILNEYNDGLNNENKLSFSDMSSVLISNDNEIVDNVIYILSALAIIILLITSFMIAVITSISVAERKKEIGILRAMGASKNNISTIFSAEASIIGLLSSLFGIGIVYLSIPLINLVIHNATNSYEINATLSLESSIILVIIIVFLTVIAGKIPSREAVKQNPAEALRSK